jgi:hypothetical protein
VGELVTNLSQVEHNIRRSLGIPLEAKKVLIFAESSHWDPNWLYTSEEYYRRFVEKNLDKAIKELEHEPRRVYSIECIFFLRMYWDRRPDRHLQIRNLINQRRLRLTSSGVTTADTLIPRPEPILRDFLLGQEWLRQNGMHQEPNLAYFSDSFGSSPALPSLLKAAGFTRTAITRIDGMYFLGFEINNSKKYPRPGSSAELLLKKEKSLDFIWRDRAGAEILTHWNAFTYGQGDLLAHWGLSRNYLFPIAVPARSRGHVRRRIRKFADKLTPYSRSPYMFCPIGFDFVPPIRDLVSLLDRYNREEYPVTGIWSVNAGLDDYLDLVECYRNELPVIELDPNPYWTGFYTARPALKKRCHELVEDLTLAESLALLPENMGVLPTLAEEYEQVWWTAAVSNHHDFITGTSPDRVVYREQHPWLDQAHTTLNKLIERLTPASFRPNSKVQPKELPHWERADGRIEIRTPHVLLELDENAGGAIVRAEDPKSGKPLLGGMANDLIRYRVTGGLWRMGYEFNGGRWKEAGRASDNVAHMEVRELGGGLEFSWKGMFDGETFERHMWIDCVSPRIHFRLIGRAGRRRTVTVQFDSGLNCDQLRMDSPGGVVFRPLEKVYSPTFWPFQRFLQVQDRANGRGMTFFLRRPGAASFNHDGMLQVVALRNASVERAYGLLPVSGNPASGYEKETYTFDYAVEFTTHANFTDGNHPDKIYTNYHSPWDDSRVVALWEVAEAQVNISRKDVILLADKPASRGLGRIIRLLSLNAQRERVIIHLEGQTLKGGSLCDARERDIEPLDVVDGCVELQMPGAIATVRLIT